MTLYTSFFLICILPLSAVVYYILPNKIRPFFISALSLLFYFSASQTRWLLPLLAVLTYLLSHTASCGGYIMLFLFAALRLFSATDVGLSFFMLRSAAYLFEGHKEKNIFKLSSFLLFFPTFIAGPITFYEDISLDKKADFALIKRGIVSLVFGLLKKLFFADTLLAAFNTFAGGITNLSALLALLCYSLYIYFDFSGYSEIAIGICNIFGISLPKNFDYPYLSRSVGEFFRRWHISLGRWLFRFVYLPLGGSKKGRGRLVLSLFCVWLFSAFWHGSSLNYFLWGGYLFLLLAFEKLVLKKEIGRATTTLLVCLGWIPFFSPSAALTLAFLKRLFCFGDILLYCRADIYNGLKYIPFILLSAVSLSPIWHKVFERWEPLLALPAAALVFSCILAGSHAPFLYGSF